MRQSDFSCRLAFVVSAAVLGTGVAHAQATPPTREQVTLPPPPPPQEPRSTATVNERGAFAPGPCPLKDSDIQVAIREVRFSAPGGQPLAPELLSLLSGIGTSSDKQAVSVVCRLRDEANARLAGARYVATVQIPPQRIDDGVLNLEVITGRIVDIHVRGDAGPFENLLRDRIKQLEALSPLRASDAERILMLTNDVPGLSVQLGLSPSVASGQPGDLVGDLIVTFRRVSVIGNIQNYNSKLLGRETAYLRASYYDLLGLDDETFVAGSSTFDFKEQRIVQVGESIGVGNRGDRLSVVGTLADSRPSLTNLDLRTISTIAGIEFTHPFVRTVSDKLELSGGFEYAQQRTRVYGGTGSVPLNRDRISALYLRLDGARRKLRLDGSQAWQLDGTVELRKGLDILGATKRGVIVDGYAPTNFNGSATGLIARGQLNGSVAVDRMFELATSLRGQWSQRQLLNYDKFSLGNLTIGRGYDPGANTGDRAIAGSHEARLNFALSNNLTVQIYDFYDWVHLWNLDPASTERSRTLASLGAGVRFMLDQSLRLDLTYAHPLDPPLLTGVNIHRAPDRFMFSLTAQLVPFGFGR